MPKWVLSHQHGEGEKQERFKAREEGGGGIAAYRTNHALRKQMHIHPYNAGLDGGNDGLRGIQHRRVHKGLLLRKHSWGTRLHFVRVHHTVGREGARDVRAVAGVLTAHIEQTGCGLVLVLTKR